MSQEDIDLWLAAYAEQYAALSDEITVEYLMEEALCDLAADIDYLDPTEAGYQALEEVQTRGQKNTAREGGRYSLSDKIALGSSEDERYQILKNRTLKIAAINQQKADQISREDMSNLVRANRTTAFKILRKIGDEFGVFKDYATKDFDLEFAYSKRNLQESINKQGRAYGNYALMLTELENIIENAVGIETHNRRYGEEGQIKQTYVFTSAMQTNDTIIPVLMEVREFWDSTKSALRIAISMSEIERSRIVEHIPSNIMSEQSYSLPASTIKIAELFSNVNSKDGRLLKYIPDGFLNEAQKKGKENALIEQKEYVRKKLEQKRQKLSIAGRNAATANLEKLDQARDLEVNGYTPGEIYRETGWFRGADGQWRFEIDDSTMRYYRAGDAKFRKDHPGYARYQDLFEKFVNGTITEAEAQEMRGSIYKHEHNRLKERVDRGGAHLDDILDHDALFAAYPALRDVKIEFAETREGLQGVYRRRDNKIVLSDKLRREPENTLIHEIQHAIQALEGFANGANRAYWAQIIERGGTIDSKRLRDANAAVYAFEANPANKAVIDARNRLNEAWDKEGARAGNAVYAELEAEGLADQVDAYEDLLWEQSSASVAYLNSFPADLYENTAGEQEARDVTARRRMTAEERAQTMPQTGTKDTVFAEGSVAAYAEEQRSIKKQIQENLDTLNQMQPVANVTCTGAVGSEPGALRKWIIEKLRPTGFKVDRQGFGEIIFDEKRLNTALNYFENTAEAAAYQAIPQVLKRGKQVGGHDNHKGREYETVTFAASITIKGKRGNMAVVVKKTNRNYYKMHRVMTPDGKLFALTENNDAELTPAGALPEKGTHAAPNNSASKWSIAEDAETVKEELTTEQQLKTAHR